MHTQKQTDTAGVAHKSECQHRPCVQLMLAEHWMTLLFFVTRTTENSVPQTSLQHTATRTHTESPKA